MTPCSIFSHCGHVGWGEAMICANLVEDILLMMCAKFQSNPFSGFGEDFLRKVNDDDDDGRRRTPSDGNSSHDPSGQVS